jgi:predicted lipoprotein with Yx(FWY)xxD motif
VTRLTASLLAAATVAAAALVVVVLSRSPRAQVHHADIHAGRVADVRVARTRLGRILVDGRGRTLYLFLKDRHGKSACSRGCLRVWPPVIVSGAPRAGAGVRVAKLGTTERADQTRQLVYNGHPLYRMIADVRPGQIAGEGFLDLWYVVSPAGKLVGKRSKAADRGY